MKIVIIGLGSIGGRYAALLKEHYRHEIFLFRSGTAGAKSMPGYTEIRSWNELMKLSPDVAFITNPTSCHIATAIKCARMGMHLYVEKPIDKDTKGLDELIKIVDKKRLVTYVAYCLRFNPLIRDMHDMLKDKQTAHARIVCTSYLPAWRPGIDYSKTYSAKSKMGGGVILDVSHEIDYSEYLFGEVSDISGRAGRLSSLKLDCEDYADILVTCKKALVNIHLNFFSKYNERSVALDFSDGSYIRADLLSGVLRYGTSQNEKKRCHAVDVERMYLDQIQYFFANLAKKNTRMMNSLPIAGRLFKKILEFKHA